MNTANVSVGSPKTAGALYVAPAGTTLPTSADAQLDVAFLELGFASEDGVTNNNSSESTEIKAWGGQTVLVVGTEKSDEFGITLIESLNPTTLETVYGSDNVTFDSTTGTIALNVNGETVPEQAFVIDMAMTGGALKRIVIPKGTISELGEITYKDDEAVGYDLTIKALPDGSGNTHYEYIKLASVSSATISLNKSTETVAKNATATLTATVSPAGGHVIWGTSDASKATVNQSGVVTGVAAGSAVITAYCNGVTASCTVTVTN